MSKQRRLLLMLGAAAGGCAAAAVVPIATAFADPCSIGDCTLISAGNPIDTSYQGFRPLTTEWVSTQPVNVDVTQAGTSFVSGSYNVSEQNFTSSVLDQATYKYGAFTPASGMSGTDSMGLSGVTVHDLVIGPGAGVTATGSPTAEFSNLTVNYPSGTQIDVTDYTGHFTNLLESSTTGSGDWILLPGQTSYTMLWDSLSSPNMPALAEVFATAFPPDVWGPDLASAFPPELL